MDRDARTRGDRRLVAHLGADEPSGNLDQAGADSLHELLSTLSREGGVTFVIVTHNDRLARIADRQVRLDAGRLTAVR